MPSGFIAIALSKNFSAFLSLPKPTGQPGTFRYRVPRLVSAEPCIAVASNIIDFSRSFLAALAKPSAPSPPFFPARVDLIMPRQINGAACLGLATTTASASMINRSKALI